MARAPIEIDVLATLRIVARADGLAARAMAGGELTGADLDALYALHEELTGYLVLLLAGTESRYEHLMPRTPMRVLVDDALRLGGDLVARQPRLGPVFDIVVIAPICRLLLALYQGRQAFTRHVGSSPLAGEAQEATADRDSAPTVGEQ
ncbi:hypothetical protein [Kitasatospora aureofaciens]|uniref:hypothetical protein n=1 Tax=Kitasatospora aureofaciens TaxID=1894 RepID=UPI0033C14321